MESGHRADEGASGMVPVFSIALCVLVAFAVLLVWFPSLRRNFQSLWRSSKKSEEIDDIEGAALRVGDDAGLQLSHGWGSAARSRRQPTMETPPAGWQPAPAVPAWRGSPTARGGAPERMHYAAGFGGSPGAAQGASPARVPPMHPVQGPAAAHVKDLAPNIDPKLLENNPFLPARRPAAPGGEAARPENVSPGPPLFEASYPLLGSRPMGTGANKNDRGHEFMMRVSLRRFEDSDGRAGPPSGEAAASPMIRQTPPPWQRSPFGRGIGKGPPRPTPPGALPDGVVRPGPPPMAAPPPVEGPVTPSPDSNRVPSGAYEIPFGQLQLGELLGQGAFGRVHRARWRGTEVAVKTLAVHHLSQKVVEEFRAEVAVLASLRHPNIVLFMGACSKEPNYALVTELAPRGSLWNLLHNEDQPLPWFRRLRMASDAARGMAYLHGSHPPLLHRDLKSANLLVDSSYTVKLSDFGLSRVKAVAQTMTGHCGTLQWMAPEVLGSERYSEKADVYSFGIIMWELATRECPFDGEGQIQVAMKVLNDDARPPRPGGCPAGYVELMKSCWQRDASKRPGFLHVLSVLERILAAVEASS